MTPTTHTQRTSDAVGPDIHSPADNNQNWWGSTDTALEHLIRQVKGRQDIQIMQPPVNADEMNIATTEASFP